MSQFNVCTHWDGPRLTFQVTKSKKWRISSHFDRNQLRQSAPSGRGVIVNMCIGFLSRNRYCIFLWGRLAIIYHADSLQDGFDRWSAWTARSVCAVAGFTRQQFANNGVREATAENQRWKRNPCPTPWHRKGVGTVLRVVNDLLTTRLVFMNMLALIQICTNFTHKTSQIWCTCCTWLI